MELPLAMPGHLLILGETLLAEKSLKQSFISIMQRYNPCKNIYAAKEPDLTKTLSWGDQVVLLSEKSKTNGIAPHSGIFNYGFSSFMGSYWQDGKSELHKIDSADPQADFFASLANSPVGTAAISSIPMLFFIMQHNEFAKILSYMHEKLHATAKVIQAYRQIEQILTNTPFAEDIQAISQLIRSAQPNTSKILALLASKTIQKDHFSLVLSNWGTILTANHLLENSSAAEIRQLVQPMVSIGEIDSYLAAAETLLEAERNQRGPWCFASYSSDHTPCFNLIQFWNPLTVDQTPVQNSLSFDTQKQQNILLTGPNGSGKSTNAKGIIYNLVLAQTFGIAFAQQLHIAPYAKLLTAFNEPEDIALGDSSFMAEEKKLTQLCKTLGQTSKNDRVFIFLDEAVKGTIEEAAGKILLKTCVDIAQHANGNALIITHATAPLQAAELTNNFSNYFVHVEQDSKKFIRTFLLKPGNADWWFKNPDTRDAFIDFLRVEHQ